MSDQTLTETIKADVKTAMKARDKERLATLRLIQAEFKRIEVDERVEIDDTRALAVLDKMVKQRRDSAQQYTDAGRTELADKENAEIDVIQAYLPAQLGEDVLIAMSARPCTLGFSAPMTAPMACMPEAPEAAMASSIMAINSSSPSCAGR